MQCSQARLPKYGSSKGCRNGRIAIRWSLSAGALEIGSSEIQQGIMTKTAGIALAYTWGGVAGHFRRVGAPISETIILDSSLSSHTSVEVRNDR
jgi:hypothetical protein